MADAVRQLAGKTYFHHGVLGFRCVHADPDAVYRFEIIVIRMKKLGIFLRRDHPGNIVGDPVLNMIFQLCKAYAPLCFKVQQNLAGSSVIKKRKADIIQYFAIRFAVVFCPLSGDLLHNHFRKGQGDYRMINTGQNL